MRMICANMHCQVDHSLVLVFSEQLNIVFVSSCHVNKSYGVTELWALCPLFLKLFRARSLITCSAVLTQ